MSVVDYVRRQWSWRSWTTAIDALPGLDGRTVLDLGCAAGDLAWAFAGRGARVIGMDLDEECLRAARALDLPGARFEKRDLRGPAAPNDRT
jgi:2-polyprenyl-3-methyl-5-hydroxy-6-metoxy-1,4-benzoquinol methylase